MSDMIRKQIYLRKKQVQAIQKRAEASGVTESELIRRAIDDALYGPALTNRPDPAALEQIEAFIQSLKAHKPAGQPIQFQRDELYEDRLKRYGAQHPD